MGPGDREALPPAIEADHHTLIPRRSAADNVRDGIAALLSAGLPLVFLANRLVVQLTTFEEDLVDEDDARALPWQQGAWPARVRWATLLLLPVLMAVAASRFDLLQAIVVSALVAALLLITATDLLRFRVPNVITYPGILAALAAAVLMPNGSIGDALLAALLGGGVFFALALITRGGIGLGDVKLAVLIGAALGLQVAYSGAVLRHHGGGGGHGPHADRGHRRSPPAGALRAVPVAGGDHDAADARRRLRSPVRPLSRPSLRACFRRSTALEWGDDRSARATSLRWRSTAPTLCSHRRAALLSR